MTRRETIIWQGNETRKMIKEVISLISSKHNILHFYDPVPDFAIALARDFYELTAWYKMHQSHNVMSSSIAESILCKVVADMRRYDQLIDRLHDQGYTVNFTYVNGKMKCIQTRSFFLPKALRVDQMYHIEDRDVGLKRFYLYALSYQPDDLKGLFLTQYKRWRR